MRRYFKRLDALDADNLIRCVDCVRVDARSVVFLLKMLGIADSNIVATRSAVSNFTPLAPKPVHLYSTHSPYSTIPLYATTIQSTGSHARLVSVFEYLAVSRPFLMDVAVGVLITDLPTSRIEARCYFIIIHNSSRILLADSHVIVEKDQTPDLTKRPIYPQIQALFTLLSDAPCNLESTRIIDLLRSSHLKLSPQTLSLLYAKCSSFSNVRKLLNYTHIHYFAPSLFIQVLLKHFIATKDLSNAHVWYTILKRTTSEICPIILIQLIKLFHSSNSQLQTLLDGASETTNLKLVTSIMVGYYKLGDTEKVLDWYSKCKEFDGIVTNVVMNAIIQEGGVEAGYKFYRDLMKGKINANDSKDRKEYLFEPSSQLDVIKTESESSLTNALDSISDLPVDVNVFNSILDSLINNGNFEKFNFIFIKFNQSDLKKLLLK